MRVTDEIHYQASPASVFEMLADADFQERKCRATGAVEQTVDVVEHGDGEVTITSERVMPTDSIPEMFRSLVGDSLRLVQVESWYPADADGSGARNGTIEVTIPGTPIGFTGELHLSADGPAGSVERIDGELKARVPLIGGKIEQAVEPAIRAAIRAERRTGTAWLAEASGG